MRNSETEPVLGAAFTVGEARAAGWRDARLYAKELDRPFHGVRAVAPFDPDSLSPEDRHLRLVHAYAVGMGRGFFISHLSAAVAWGVPLPHGAVGDLVDACAWMPRRSPRGAGVRGRAVDPRLVRVVVHPELGYRLSTPASTWAMLGAVLAHPYDLIAAGDALVRAPQHPDDPAALATVDQLAAAVDAGRRVGVRALRDALPRVRPGASSRPETWTRLTLVDAGLPEPTLAYEVRDDAGAFVARLDLAYPELKIAIEYEGAHHLLDAGQWTKDIARYERLAALGWTVIRVTRDDLFTRPDELAARVRTARRAAA